jgi:hypothetical protein
MKYQDSNVCICGHLFEDHDCHEDGWCLECSFEADELKQECQQFKLDNLRFVEHLAKKRGLV